MKNIAVNAIGLALSSAGVIYSILSAWVGLDPLPVAAGIGLVSLFLFWYVLIWTAQEIASPDKKAADTGKTT